MKRALLAAFLIVFMAEAKAQTVGAFPYSPCFTVTPYRQPADSGHTYKKWTFSKYVSLSASYSFFRGGNAATVAVPVGVQLSRSLTNNLFAFAGASLAPAYTRFNTTLLPADFIKNGAANPFSQTGRLGMYSKAELGLGYTNDARTFTISGSIGIERNSYAMPYYRPASQTVLPSPVLR